MGWKMCGGLSRGVSKNHLNKDAFPDEGLAEPTLPGSAIYLRDRW